jgi:hypothetical protein
MQNETDSQTRQNLTYVRPSRVEVEPIVSAAALVALVFAVNAWWTPPAAQQSTPAVQTATLTTASSN